MANTYQYKAFISYSHSDKAAADRLLRDIENYRVPRRLVGRAAAGGTPIPARVGHIFRDRDELPAAEDLTAEVKKALRQSEFMIVLCSPAAAASRWVNREIIEFKKLTGERRILSVVLSGEPFASSGGAPEQECFPPALRFKLGQGGTLTTEPAEPLAADFRDAGDGPRRGRLKLVAGLLGISLDALIERDLQRKMRRVMAVTAASVAAMIGMASLTYEAVTARQDAERHRSEAEGLIEFMLTDLRDKLEPVGRLDVLDAVGEKAVDYYDRQELGDMPDDALGRRARAFHLLGEIDDNQGDLEGAREKFEAAYQTTAAQLAQDPNNPDRIFDHSQSAFWVGYPHWIQGNNNEAEKAFVEYKELAEKLVKLAPTNPTWQLESIYASQNLGTFYLRNMESPQKALGSYLSADSRYDQLVSSTEDSNRYRRDRADLHAWIGETYEMLGDFPKARKYRNQQMAFFGDIVFEQDIANDRRIESERLKGWAAVSQLDLHEGKSESAVAILKNIIGRAKLLVNTDQNNATWRELEKRYQLHLANALMINGQADDASLLIECTELDTSATNYKDRVDLKYFSQLLCARLALSSYQHQPALDIASKLIESIEFEEREKRHSPRATLYLAHARLVSALASNFLGMPENSSRIVEENIKHLEPKIDRLHPNTKDILSRSFILLGKKVTGMALVEQLKQQGYANSEFIHFLNLHAVDNH